MPWLRSVNNKSFNTLRKETTVYRPNAVDEELSHQVTDVVEKHSVEQAGRKQKISTRSGIQNRKEGQVGAEKGSQGILAWGFDSIPRARFAAQQAGGGSESGVRPFVRRPQ